MGMEEKEEFRSKMSGFEHILSFMICYLSSHPLSDLIFPDLRTPAAPLSLLIILAAFPIAFAYLSSISLSERDMNRIS